MLSAESTSAFLIGRLAQEGRQPRALLTASSGRWRGLTGLQVFAVDTDRLWLAQPRLLGEPSIASVPLDEVGGVTVRSRPGRPRPGGRDAVRLEIALAGGTVRCTVQDGDAACARFVEAVRGGAARR